MISLETRNNVVRQRASGYSYDVIATDIGISKPTVMEICRTRESEIVAMQDISIASTNDDARYATSERSKLYRQLIGTLHAQIMSRDLSEVSTERLFTMLERTERSLSIIEQRQTVSSDGWIEELSDDELLRISSAITR